MDLGGKKDVEKEMLGGLAQSGGNERKVEEGRDEERYFMSDQKHLPDE